VAAASASRPGSRLGVALAEVHPPETLERHQLRRLERERGLVRGEGQGRVRQCRLCQLAEAEVQLQPSGGARGDAEALLVEPPQGQRVADLLQGPLELEGSAGIAGIGGEGPLELRHPILGARARVVHARREPERGGQRGVVDGVGEPLADVGSARAICRPGMRQEHEGTQMVGVGLQRRFRQCRRAVELSALGQGVGQAEPGGHPFLLGADQGRPLEELRGRRGPPSSGLSAPARAAREVVGGRAQHRLQRRRPPVASPSRSS
jgi:hypothetical protein